MPKLFEAVRDTKAGPRVARTWASLHTRLYRATDGRLGADWPFHKHFPRLIPICLLTTTGRKTGIPRTRPVVYATDGPNVVVAGSAGGMTSNPQWIKNIEKDADVTVQIKGVSRDMRGEIVADVDEYERLWALLVAVFPGFDEYQSNIDRQIPIVIFT